MEASSGSNSNSIIALAALLIILCLCGLICVLIIGAGLLVRSYYLKDQPSASKISDGHNAPMNLIPDGDFIMGQDDYSNEEPVHTVFLNSYYMDLYEVTNAEYKACVDDGACAPPISLRSYTHPSYYDNPKFDHYPVIYVTWQQADDFCQWRGGRLPTEAEWEKAARGGSDFRPFPWGEGLDCTRANYDLCGTGDAVEVGSYPGGASPYGLYDMMGNVWEWVSDWYSDSYYKIASEVNPLGPATGTFKVQRGGAFNQYTNEISVSYRGQDNPVNATGAVGFRCARSAPKIINQTGDQLPSQGFSLSRSP